MNYAYAMGPATTGQGGAQPSPIMSMLPILLIFIIFYFFLIRPQQKKQQEHLGMIKKLKKNDEVITNGGIYGTIVNVKDNSFVLRIDDNCKIEVQKNSVAVLKKTRE